MNNPEIRCPVCNSVDSSKVRSFSSAEAARHIKRNANKSELKEISDYIKSKIWKQKYCDFVRCNDCGLYFANPHVAGDAFLYNILYEKSEIQKDFWKWDFEVAFNLIKKYEKKGSKILDIGAGSGHFILKMSEELFEPKSCYVVEYSDDCRKELSEKKIITFPNLSSIVQRNVQFDYVSLFQVLEHMDNLTDQLSEIDKLVEKNGIIIISVPNNFQRNFYDACEIYEDVPPTHINRFTKQSFEKIAKKANWEIIEHQYEPSKFSKKFRRFLSIGLRYDPYFKRNKMMFSKKNKFLRKIFNLYSVLRFCVKNILNITRLFLNKNVGTAQIVVFRKK